jgi:hypothetical protein
MNLICKCWKGNLPQRMEKAFPLLRMRNWFHFHAYFSRLYILLMKPDTLKLVYFAYLCPVLSYWLILWGNSTDGSKVFNIQKKIIRIMAAARTVSCIRLFCRFNILPLASEYITRHSLMELSPT